MLGHLLHDTCWRAFPYTADLDDGACSGGQATLLKDLKELQATGSCSISPLQLAGAVELSDHEKHRQCAEYLLAGRQACRGRQNISVGLDASRVAFRGRQNIAVVLPDNPGVWRPPQVPPDSYQNCKFIECGSECLLFPVSLGGLKRCSISC